MWKKTMKVLKGNKAEFFHNLRVSKAKYDSKSEKQKFLQGKKIISKVKINEKIGKEYLHLISQRSRYELL